MAQLNLLLTWPGGLEETMFTDEILSNERQNMSTRFSKKRFVKSHDPQASPTFKTVKDSRRFTHLMNLYNRNPEKAHNKIDALDKKDPIREVANKVIDVLYE